MNAAPWFARQAGGRRLTGLPLICLPHSGGGTVPFRPWEPLLAPEVSVLPVCLPGREIRATEPAVRSVTELVTDLADAIVTVVHGPFALLGHSFGALLGYALACRLHTLGRRPERLVVACSRAPQVPAEPPLLAGLASDELWRELAELGGTPPEVLANRSLRRLLEPALRADLAAAQDYRIEHVQRVDCPITAIGGTADFVDVAALRAWSDCTAGTFTLRMYQGGHFVFAERRDEVLRDLAAELAPGGPR